MFHPKKKSKFGKGTRFLRVFLPVRPEMGGSQLTSINVKRKNNLDLQPIPKRRTNIPYLSVVTGTT